MTLNFGQSLFPQRREVLASFDFQDLITSQGKVSFLLGTAYNDSGTETNIIKTNIFDSITEKQETTLSTDEAGFTKIVDDDYDLEAGTTQIIEGQAVAEFKFGVSAVHTGGGNDTTTVDGYTIVRVRKWDGTTETEIGSAKTQELNAERIAVSSGTTTTEEVTALVIDCAKTSIKRGEYLRITVEQWYKMSRTSSATDSGRVFYYTDPNGNLGEAINYSSPSAEGEVFQYKENTEFKIDVPFKITV